VDPDYILPRDAAEAIAPIRDAYQNALENLDSADLYAFTREAILLLQDFRSELTD